MLSLVNLLTERYRFFFTYVIRLHTFIHNTVYLKCHISPTLHNILQKMYNL